MPTHPTNPDEGLAGKSPDDALVRVGEIGTREPSIEEVVERLERVRPTIVFGARLSAPNLAGQSIGRYTIRRIVGRGAFGVVYQAHDEQLGRDVALKVPRPEVLFDEEKLRRFESEAATAATLEHPSIIPIYEADLSGPTPYIASAYCVGPDLGQWLANRETPIPVEQAMRFVIKLSEAVHYAHRQGVLHRDLKPSNIMLEPCRNTSPGKNQLEHFEPRLTDFGLAKLLEGGPQDTHSSIMLGTPRYMAPEQFNKRLGDVGVQSDVYALGAILYELLLGEPAALGSSHMELMLSILDREVTPPSRVRPSVTPTLDAVCLKALEKRPSARYLTALELAEDLGRYLRGEPTLARPLALPGRVIKWIGLNRLAASLLAVISASIVGLVLGTLWHNHRLGEQLTVSDRLRIESAESAKQFLRARYVADMQLTQQAIRGGRFSEAQSRLEKYRPESDGAEVSDFAWHLLAGQLKNTYVDFEFRGPLRTLATSEVLEASVTGGEDGMLRFFDTASGVQLATIKAHEGNVNAIVFAADGTRLVSGGDDGTLCVWDTSSLRDGGKTKQTRSQKAHEGDLLCLAVSPDGKWIASGGVDNRVRLWDFKDLEPAGEMLGHTDWVRALDFSPDGAMLVSGSHDGTIRRWDIQTKSEVGKFVGHDKLVLCLKHHPTEPLLVSGGKDRSIRFWDISTGEQRQQIDVFNDWVRSLSLSADGNRIAVSADDPRVMLFERTSNGQYEPTHVAFTNRTKNLGIAFANPGSHVVSVGIGGASAWAIDADLSGEKIYATEHFPYCLATSSNENSLTLVTGMHVCTVDLEGGTNRKSPLSVQDAAISRDGSLIASKKEIGNDERTRIQLSERGKEGTRLLYSGKGYFYGIDMSPSGKCVAAATSNLLVRIWKAPDFEQEIIVRSPFENDYDSIFVNDAGTQLFLQPSFSHEMTVLDVATSQPVATLQNVESLLNRSADGRLLAIAKSDYSVAIYDTKLGQTVQALPSHANKVIGACFSPVEPMMATITSEGEIALWALDTGEILLRFQAAFSKKFASRACLAFTSEGRTLAVAGAVYGKQNQRRTELRVWRVPQSGSVE